MFQHPESSQEGSALMGVLPPEVRQFIYFQHALDLIKDPAPDDVYNYRLISPTPLAGHRVSTLPALLRTCQRALREAPEIIFQFACLVFQNCPDLLWHAWKGLQSPSSPGVSRPLFPDRATLRAVSRAALFQTPHSLPIDTARIFGNHQICLIHGVGNFNPQLIRHLSLVVHFRMFIFRGDDREFGQDGDNDTPELYWVIPDLRGVLAGAENIEHVELVVEWDHAGRFAAHGNFEGLEAAFHCAREQLRYPLSVIRGFPRLKTLTLGGLYEERWIHLLRAFLPGVGVFRGERHCEFYDLEGTDAMRSDGEEEEGDGGAEIRAEDLKLFQYPPGMD